MCWLFILIEHFNDFVGLDIPVSILIHHHHRRQAAGPQTPNGIQCKSPVFGGAAFFELVFVVDAAHHFFNALHITGSTQACLDVVPAFGSQGK